LRGSGVAGFFMGMFLRRVLKFIVIIIGSFLGAVFLGNGCRRVNISKVRLTGREWEMILWYGCNLFLFKFPVPMFLGHWESYSNIGI
jgi:hypothetical protein